MFWAINYFQDSLKTPIIVKIHQKLESDVFVSQDGLDQLKTVYNWLDF